MSAYYHPLEMHVHGELPLRPDIATKQVHEALRPLWEYAGALSFAEGANSLYDEEPGILWDATANSLRLCWTVAGDEGFRQSMEEACMGLNELSQKGAAIEVTFYDVAFNEDEERDDYDNSRDDFMLFFVGPTPAAIMQAQRDLLVQDVLNVMERHFDATELGEVVQTIDGLFKRRFDTLLQSLEINRTPRSQTMGGHTGRRFRRLH